IVLATEIRFDLAAEFGGAHPETSSRQSSAGLIACRGTQWTCRADRAYRSDADALMLALPDQAQALKRQVGGRGLNHPWLFRDHRREPAGRDTNDALWLILQQLDSHPIDEALDHRDVAEEQAGLDRLHGRSPNQARRLSHVDARQLRGALKQR